MRAKPYEYHDPVPGPKTGKPVRLGQTVTRTISCGVDPLGHVSKEKFKGTVVWIHPKGRFHVVEFGAGMSRIREAFFGS